MADENQKGYPTEPAQPPPEQAYPPPGTGYPPAQEANPPSQGYPPQPQPGYPLQPQPEYPPQQEYPPSGAPPAYSATQPPPPQGQTVVVSTVHSSVVQTFRDRPVNVTCPNCKNNVTSSIDYENGMLVILLIVVIAFVFQLWCGCCLIPLCIKDVKDVNHNCPVCSYRLGTYKRLN